MAHGKGTRYERSKALVADRVAQIAPLHVEIFRAVEILRRVRDTLSPESGRNSVVECQLPKLDVVGSNPIARFPHFIDEITGPCGDDDVAWID